MPVVKVSGLGQEGIWSDPPRFSLPPNVLSFGQNVRMYHGRLRSFGGHQVQATAPIEPHGLFAFTTLDRAWLWLEAGLSQVYAYDGNTHTNITRASGPYTLNEATSRWTGGTQAGMGFLCPGLEDYPQVWAPIATTQQLVDMTYDPHASVGSRTWADLGYAAYAMRPFKSTIFALNVSRGPTNLSSTVQWCDFLAPGDTEPDFVPRATNSAGEQPLSDTTGNIIDGAPLRDDFIIYKEDAAYRATFTGDADTPFAFDRLPDYVRLINRNCIGMAGEFHVLASRDDVQVFDGNVFRSILDNKLREFYTTTLDQDRQQAVFVAVLNGESEVWICFPRSSDEASFACDRAIVWNYNDNTLSLTQLPNVRDMDEGVIVTPQSDTYADNSLTYAQDTLRFGQSPFQSNRAFMIGAHGTSVSVFGEATTDNGTPRECIAERQGLALPDGGQNGSVQRVHMMRSLRPYMQSTGPVDIRLGSQMHPGGPITWDPYQPFDPATQSEINSRATGRYFAWRVRSNADVQWEMTDLEIRYELRRAR